MAIDLKDLDVPHYMSDLPVDWNAQIASGTLDIQSTIAFLRKEKGVPSLEITGEIDCKKLVVNDLEKHPLLKVSSLHIAIGSSDLFVKQIRLSKVFLKNPQLTVVRDQGGVLNLEKLLKKGAVPPTDREKKPVQEQEKASSVLTVEAHKIEAVDGKLFFSDHSRDVPFQTTMEEIHLEADHFSTLENRKTALKFSFRTRSGEVARTTSEASVHPLLAEGDFEIAELPLKKYSPYYRDRIVFDVEEGKAGISGHFFYRKGQEAPEFRLSNLLISLTSLQLKRKDEKERFMLIPEASIKNTEFDLPKKLLAIGDFFSQRGILFVSRSRKGKWNIQNLFPASAETGGPPTKTDEKISAKPWVIKARAATFDRYTINVRDRVPAQPVNIAAEKIQLKIEDFSTEDKSTGKASLSLLLNKRGNVSASGSFSIDPTSADLKVALKAVEVLPFQPYFTDRINILLTDGTLSTEGRLIFKNENKKDLNVNYKGTALLANFSSIDKVSRQDFVKWKSLSFKSAEAEYQPFSLSLQSAALTDFYAKIQIHPDGTLNVFEIINRKQDTAAASSSRRAGRSKDVPHRRIALNVLTLQGGEIDFTDNHIKPPYSMSLVEIGGRISGLSSRENSSADVDLKGKIDNYAPIQITGKMNPLREDLFVDLKGSVKGVDLTPFTPYSSKYVGYTVEKGKLTLEMKYLIRKKELEARNEIFLDQLSFGEKVESPGATTLPVKLAIALLKNRKGEISLDVPVKGRLDNPNFSFGDAVLQIFKNILHKAARSPFTLLSSVLGGNSEAYQSLEFDYGSPVISKEGKKKLDNLIKALYDRPSLRLNIEGNADLEEDREALKKEAFQQMLKREKQQALAKEGSPLVPLEQIEIAPEEYETYLNMLFESEKFPKPETPAGEQKMLSPSEMEKLILTHIEITGRIYASLHPSALRM